MVNVLVILDGATDVSPSSLELAYTPHLDRLAHEGETSWVDLLAPGVPVGSETAIASLLGWRPDGPVDRARVEAAARGLPDGPVRRVDLTGGHRLLVFGERTRFRSEAVTRVWPAGMCPPRILDERTVVIGAPGAATGLGALMGARVVTPPGATGRPGSDLRAKCRAAQSAVDDGAGRVVVHVGGADEAGHARDRTAKIAVLEHADRQIVGPLAETVRALGGSIAVGPDHGCDPATGEHVGGPVPIVTWATGGSRRQPALEPKVTAARLIWANPPLPAAAQPRLDSSTLLWAIQPVDGPPA
jgi:2,3-bisphosphoglycerate-independent phosphoglycerate mutase